MTDAKAWRSKYQRTLEELEHLKSDWESERTLLRRGIAKMSIAAQGFDIELDRLFDDLRKYARGKQTNGVAGLESAIQSLETALESIDGRRVKEQSDLIHTIQKLLLNIKPQLAEEESIQKVRNLEAHIERAIKKSLEPELLKWLRLLANLQLDQASNEERPAKAALPNAGAGPNAGTGPNAGAGSQTAQLTQVSPRKPEKPIKPEKNSKAAKNDVNETEESSKKKPILGKLLGVFERADEVKKEESRESQETKTMVDIACSTDQVLSCLDDTRHALKAFLVELDPPAEAQQMVQDLHSALESEMALESVPKVIGQLSDITASVIGNMGSEFNGFLHHIESSLDVIGDALGYTVVTQSNPPENSEIVEAKIREKMADLFRNVEQASELDPLKASVKSNIQIIVGQLDEFKRLRSAQHDDMASQLKDLVRKVEQIEQDSEKKEKQLTKQLEKSYLDQLTQVPNRAAYEMKLSEEFERWKRYQHPLSLIVCDIDYFKLINDTYGHLAGDKVLKILGEALSEAFRKTDFVARYGGEEFVILLPETQQEAAYIKAEEVRKVISDLAFHFKDKDVTITASLGVASFQSGDEPASVFERADQALYQAKSAGRNRVVDSGG